MSIWDSGRYENISPGNPYDAVANGNLELIMHGSRHEFDAPGAVKAPMPAPGSVSPMLCTTLEKPFSDPAWQFEIKWDDYRELLIASALFDLAGYTLNREPHSRKLLCLAAGRAYRRAFAVYLTVLAVAAALMSAAGYWGGEMLLGGSS